MRSHARPRRPAVAAALLTLAGLAASVAPAALPSSPLAAVAATTTGSLAVTPDSYVPGQAIRFRGRLGTPHGWCTCSRT